MSEQQRAYRQSLAQKRQQGQNPYVSKSPYEPELTACEHEDEEMEKKKKEKEESEEEMEETESIIPIVNEKDVKALSKAYQAGEKVHISIPMGRAQSLELFAQPSRDNPNHYKIATVVNESTAKPIVMGQVHKKTGVQSGDTSWVHRMRAETDVDTETLEKVIRTAFTIATQAALVAH